MLNLKREIVGKDLDLYLSHAMKKPAFCIYSNDPKFSDTQALANSVDPDQTAPRGAV